MVDRTAQPASQRQVRGQRRQPLGVVARVVGELDGDGLGAAVGHRAVQLVDGTLSLDALVEPDEPDALRQAYRDGGDASQRESRAAEVRQKCSVSTYRPCYTALGTPSASRARV